MPDLNDLLIKTRRDASDIEDRVNHLLIDYDNLYREAQHELTTERQETGSMDGLEDFYHLTQILRRNRDVVASVMRAVKNLRATDKYSFIEETDKPKKKEKELKINKKELSKIQISDTEVLTEKELIHA